MRGDVPVVCEQFRSGECGSGSHLGRFVSFNWDDDDFWNGRERVGVLGRPLYLIVLLSASEAAGLRLLAHLL